MITTPYRKESEIEKKIKDLVFKVDCSYGESIALERELIEIYSSVRREDMEAVKGIVNSFRRKPTMHQISCPDGMIGCAVYHQEERFSSEDKECNKCIDDIIRELSAPGEGGFKR